MGTYKYLRAGIQSVGHAPMCSGLAISPAAAMPSFSIQWPNLI
jgi:hypothetical protein